MDYVWNCVAFPGMLAGPKRVIPRIAETLKMTREAFAEQGAKAAKTATKPKPPSSSGPSNGGSN
eukprot:m.4499 g.4499  ORF g.4499 m.4499 type:complete len:64 (+) comp4503_c0_seq2:274-465(+)